MKLLFRLITLIHLLKVDRTIFAFAHSNSNQNLVDDVFTRLDRDKNDCLTTDELCSMLQYLQNKHIDKRTNEMWPLDKDKTEKISWTEIVDKYYGFMNDSKIDQKMHEYASKQFERDRKRFEVADFDNDHMLTYDEFQCFVHPDRDVKTRHVMVEETLSDMDINKDGYVSIDEYIHDIWTKHSEGDLNPEPKWVLEERQNFNTHRDHNKDGKLDFNEIQDMLFPLNHDPIKAEANHILREADDNKDGCISKEELSKHVDLFVGSNSNLYSIKDEL